MQDDNQEKKLGDLLRNYQETKPQQYDDGAWESFDRLRKPKVIPFWYWAGGIVASLLLLWAVGSLIWSETELTPASSDQVLSEVVKESTPGSISNPEGAFETEEKIDESEGERHLTQKQPLEEKSNSNSKQTENSPANERLISKNESPNQQAKRPVLESTLAQAEEIALNQQVESKESQAAKNDEQTKSEQNVEVAQTTPAYLTEEEAKAKLLAQIGEELTEEKPEEEASNRTVALGFGPGFGSSGGDEPTSGSSLNLGVLMGIGLGEKVTLSSGFAVNYLNQASQSQRYAQAAGFASAVRETQEIRQVQVDIPLYVTYPVTSGGGISVQAGFSNLIAFNQSAQVESNFTRQIAVADMESSFSNTLKLQSTAVTQVSEFPVPNQRFYPFATANLGVNIRIFERKNTSYAIMPFYNYPIQEISGYGEKLGFYGASFKILFGTTEKK